ncbi:MAG: glycerophosphodiester phosphodiesterase [Deltaproteobacteria bacterium]|nr:glycerophosphodiester phosphodiesterase [Deltaproteobacteria bacterium]
MRYLQGPRPRVFGHRGASGLAPENTLVSFRRALEDGAEYLEMDVHGTADGAVVVLHDPLVDRTTDGHGLVGALTLAEVQRLDAGFAFSPDGVTHPWRSRGVTVPTLEEVLGAFPEARLNIELKHDSDALIAHVARALDLHGARGRVLLTAEDGAFLDRIREALPEVASGFSSRDVAEFLTCSSEPSYRPRGVALQVPVAFGELPLVTAESVARAHELGLEVHAWVINDPAEMRALFALGVDGVVTDFPAVAVAVRDRGAA